MLPPTAGGEQRNNTRNRFSAPHAHPRLQHALDHQAQPESRTGYIECIATRLPSLSRTTERRKCTWSPFQATGWRLRVSALTGLAHGPLSIPHDPVALPISRTALPLSQRMYFPCRLPGNMATPWSSRPEDCRQVAGSYADRGEMPDSAVQPSLTRELSGHHTEWPVGDSSG